MEEHEHLSQEARVQAVKLEPMHIIDWEEAQEADAALAACHKWLHLRKDTLLPWWTSFSRSVSERRLRWNRARCSLYPQQSHLEKGSHVHEHNPKGETEGVLAFVVPVGQHRMALNGVHHNAGHLDQQRTLALTQERFWWPIMAEDCCIIVRGCPLC